ncbi:MAG: hypothetical protein LKI58_04265 [Actinomyces sp.]|nr:hypothetical protein [Actinomyces sp.]MCI1787269.1 hypothetical protein [Actinomyces sp.]MCI1829663.1 hypothetical protein [Actinomyces sp.]MCI1866361.1 hypothetical protein [Actinomyces sp.]
MFRVLLIIAWLAVTVYAIADWARTPEEEMPGRIPRILWLIILLLTIPSFSIGSIVWLIVRSVARAEAGGSGSGGVAGGRPILPRPQRAARPTAPPPPVAPDDDPEFLFKLERDIRRRRAEEGRRDKREGGPSADDSPSDPGTGPDRSPGPDSPGSADPSGPSDPSDSPTDPR